MEKTFKKITITKGKYKPKLNEKIKELKIEKRDNRKIFEKAAPSEKKEKLDKYMKSTIKLKEEITAFEKERVQQRIHKIIKEGGVKSDSFWKIRKKILKHAKPDEDYDTITEEGRHLTSPEETKEYIATYYENLYQARPGIEEYQEWTDHIKETVSNIEISMETQPDEEEFTPEELKEAITQ